VIGAGLAAGCLLSIGAVRALDVVLPASDPLIVLATGMATAALRID
jgi:hypothetical protein